MRLRADGDKFYKKFHSLEEAKKECTSDSACGCISSTGLLSRKMKKCIKGRYKKKYGGWGTRWGQCDAGYSVRTYVLHQGSGSQPKEAGRTAWVKVFNTEDEIREFRFQNYIHYH